VYTAEERAWGIENVRTGLRKGMDEEVEEEEEEEEEEEGGEEEEKKGEEVRSARLRLARNSVVGRFEAPPNADWEMKRKMGVGRVPVR